METRFNKIVGIFGRRGTGKSLYLLGSNFTSVDEDKKLNKKGILDLYASKKTKGLIIDSIDHPAYRNIPIMPMDKIKVWKSGFYRVIIDIKDISKLNKLLSETASVWNSVLIYEDARKHTFAKADDYLNALMGDSKQKNIDIFFMYHNFGECPPDLYRKMDYIKCFKTKDSPECRKKALTSCYEEAMQVYERVKKHTSNFYSETIDTGNE